VESPKEAYNNNMKKSGFRKEAYPYFNDKYFKNPRQPGFFLFDTNERVQVNQQKLILPGKIYTFKYDPLYKDALAYYDKRPIIFCHELRVAKTGNTILCGANLNFLPEQMRVTLLEYYYEQFKSDYDKANESLGKPVPVQKAKAFLSDWSAVEKIAQQANINYTFIFRNYIFDRITALTMVEQMDWGMIPFLESKDITGAGLGKIYADYTKSMNKAKPKGEAR
jgi:hypothetical protein